MGKQNSKDIASNASAKPQEQTPEQIEAQQAAEQLAGFKTPEVTELVEVLQGLIKEQTETLEKTKSTLEAATTLLADIQTKKFGTKVEAKPAKDYKPKERKKK